MRWGWLLLALCVMVSPASAQQATIDQIDVLSIGIYDLEEVSRVEDPTMVTGGRNLVTNVRLERATRRIPGELGMRFGYQFEVVGYPQGAETTLRFVTRFPRPMRNPNTGRSARTTEQMRRTYVGETSYRGYRFDEPWEIIPGDWTFEIWDGDVRLSSVTLTVVAP